MICLTLPNFVQNLTFNNKLNKYITKFPNHKKFNFFIGYYTGNYSYNYWNGNNNLNFGLTLLNEDFEKIKKNSIKALRLNCSNIYLNQEDFYNTYNENIFKSLENIGTYIELCNFSLYDYITQNFEGYNFIFSENADMINQIDSNIINSINEKDIFSLIEIPSYLNTNLDFLKTLKKTSNIELKLGEKCCNCSREQIIKCKNQENINQYNFSNNTVYNCGLINDYKDFSDFEKNINQLTDLGFTRFKIDYPPIHKNKEFKIYLIKNLIKEEYWYHALDYLKEDNNEY